LEAVNKDQAQNYKQLIKMLKTYNHMVEATRTNHEAKIDKLREIIGGLVYQ
jgi:hypothetical protein